MAHKANGMLFQDTDPLMTAAWSMMLFGERNPTLDAFRDTGDLYLLMNVDLPWVVDEVRMFPDRADQLRFFDLCRAELERRGVRWVMIGGDGDQRFDAAIAAIAGAC